MSRWFADAVYYVALLSERDKYHRKATEVTAGYNGHIFTTSWVLVEVANTIRVPGERERTVPLIRDLQRDEQVTIVTASEELFERGLLLFEQRPDKEWSLTDCISFVVMEQFGLTEALTADHHFEQAGFRTLMG